MTLNAAQRRNTSEELRMNLQLSQLTIEQVRTDLDFSAEQVTLALDVSPSGRPEDVWALRDYLETAASAAGTTPHPYSVLTEDARAAASRWFPLRNR